MKASLGKDISTRDDSAPLSRAWGWVAVALLTLTAGVLCLQQIYDYDILWHLACGDWMVRHGAVLGHDPFGVPEPGVSEHWVNVHWGFQVIMALLQRLGGFDLLSVAAAVLGAATALIFALDLRKRVGPAWLMACGLLLVYVLSSRFRPRPEAFTMLFLLLTLVAVEAVRRGRRGGLLWWLVPLNLAWVNMHGLFFVGPFVTWTAIASAAADRWIFRRETCNLLTRGAMAAAVAGVAVCFVNPWPWEAATHFLLLSTRLELPLYSMTVVELQPAIHALDEPFVREFAVLAVLAVAAVAVRVRRVPVAHVLWLVVFVVLAAKARRNIPLAAIFCAYLLAVHGWEIWRRVLAARPTLARASAWCCAAAVLVGAGVSVDRAIGFSSKGQNSIEFGVGLQQGELCPATAEFLRDLKAEGDIYALNFGDAAQFVYAMNVGRDQPLRRVWMDGRLEAFSTQRFRDDNRMMHGFDSADLSGVFKAYPSGDARSLRFVFMGAGETKRLMNLAQSPLFRLLFVDVNGACFARLGEPFDDRELPAQTDWRAIDRPLDRSLNIAGQPQYQSRPLHQNPRLVNSQVGNMLLAMGTLAPGAEKPTPPQRTSIRLAIRYLTAALADGLASRNYVLYRLAQACQIAGIEEHATLPVRVSLARALYLYDQIDLSKNLSAEEKRQLYLLWVTAMDQAGLLETAAQQCPATAGPVGQLLAQRLAVAKEKARQANLDAMEPAKRAAELRALGLTESAIGVLQGDRSPAGRLGLCELLLQKGQPDVAMATLPAAAELPAELRMRGELDRALCAWVGGDLYGAYDRLRALRNEKAVSPQAEAYLERLAGEIGIAP